MTGLDGLEARVREDLDRIAHPRARWLEPHPAPNGIAALDVLVVGGGQSGVAIGFGLLRACVDNILVLDRAPEGQEGPWLTYACMETLRSPKDYTGPDLDVPSLTYQSWHEARFGRADWDALGMIPRTLWAEYLLWVRRVTRVPVRNDAEVVDLAPAPGNLVAATLANGDVLHARRVVLATGQEGAGHWWMPPAVAALPPHLRAHAADPVDFAALRNRTVAVLGAGASAFDNAATALEAGAAAVHLFCRRPEPQVVQPYRWLTFAGFLRHVSELDDRWRWRFMAAVLGMREGFPQHTFDRCARWPGFQLHSGAPWDAVAADGDRVRIDTPRGTFHADFVICGTGIETDFARRPELARCANNIATWADRYQPPPDEQDERLGRFPYLAEDFTLVERVPGRTPWVNAVHLFAIASTMSFGPSGSSINAMTTAVPKLVRGITRALFTADLDRHWASFRAYDVPQAVVSLPGPALATTAAIPSGAPKA